MGKSNILVLGAGGQLGQELRAVAEGSVQHYFFMSRSELDVTDLLAVKLFVRSRNPLPPECVWANQAPWGGGNTTYGLSCPHPAHLMALFYLWVELCEDNVSADARARGARCRI